MWALGELIREIIYWTIILGGVISLISIFVTKKTFHKVISGTICLVCIILFLFSERNTKTTYNQSQLEHVGTYYLINYPYCDSCTAILKKNNTYDVMQENKVVESGDWHFESGGDYLIVYMNDDKDQLGAGRFQFDKFKDTNNIIYDSPLTPGDLETISHKKNKTNAQHYAY
jgi:hypothetical protein